MPARRIRFPQTQSTYFPFKGGLDLVTSPIAMDPGRVFDAQNYEPVTGGGYKRLDGYERFDGRAAPSRAAYWLLAANVTGALAVGDTITGLVSAHTARVLKIEPGWLTLGRASGVFQSGEALQVSGTTRATATGTALQNAETDPAMHGDRRLLAANDARADIQAVPGSGPIRGVWVYKDVVYAFRDNAAGTAGQMWRATTAGWVQVTFGREVQFTGAVGQINAGDLIVGATSGASAIVTRAMLRTGTWTVAGVGTLILPAAGAAFVNGENIQVGGITKVIANGASTAVARLPGGRMEFFTDNFTGSADTQRMYGCDGVNTAFEFDGTTYVPIRTGMAQDRPEHIAFHINKLWLSFRGSIQSSPAGQPYTWTAVLGAGEIATGSPIASLMSQTGGQQGASMAAFTRDRAFVLYGSSSADFKLVPSNDDLGFLEQSPQSVGNAIYGLTARGIHSLGTTRSYGDFNYAAVSFLLQPFLDAKRDAGLTVVSTTLKTRNQYRLFYSDGTGLIVGLTGEKVNGILPVNYGRQATCMCTDTLSTGREVTYFGGDDGFVFEDNVGTSFDGQPLEAWIRPVFNNLQSPLLRKTYRRAVFEVATKGYSRVNVTYDLGYATPRVSPAAPQPDIPLVGAGGYWGQVTWDQFTWDAAVTTEASTALDGTEKNISFLFYSNRAQDDAHTLQGLALLYTARKLERV